MGGWVFGDGVVGVFSCFDGRVAAVALFPGRTLGSFNYTA